MNACAVHLRAYLNILQMGSQSVTVTASRQLSYQNAALTFRLAVFLLSVMRYLWDRLSECYMSTGQLLDRLSFYYLGHRQLLIRLPKCKIKWIVFGQAIFSLSVKKIAAGQVIRVLHEYWIAVRQAIFLLSGTNIALGQVIKAL